MTTEIHTAALPVTAAPVSPPVIGISGMSTDSKSVAAMVAQVQQAGGIPLVLSNHAARDPAMDIEKLDGLFIMGSDQDVDPAKYVGIYPEGDPRHAVHPKTVSQSSTQESAARAAYEEKIIRLAMQKKLPTLAVCAGMQTINVMQGGGLLQHIPDLIGDEHHEQSTQGIAPFCPVVPVTITQQSNLGAIAGKTLNLYTPSTPPPAGTVGVNENSFHHQAVDPDRIGTGLRAVAYSDSYVNARGQLRLLPEALEPDPAGPLAGWPMQAVQWHPEFGASKVSANLIANSVAQAGQYAQTAPRDRSHDQTMAMAANIVSSKKAEGFLADLLATRQNSAPVHTVSV